MRNSRDEHEVLRIVHAIADAVVSDTDPVLVPARKLHDARWSRVRGQTVYRVTAW